MKTRMKSLRGVLFAMLAVTVSLVLTSCSKDYAKVIPADCSGVMRVNVAAISDKAGLEDNADVKDIKEKILDAADKKMSRKSTDRLKEMLDDPAQFGVDLRDPVYFFGPSKRFAYSGMVAKVLSRSDLQEFVEMMLKESGEGRLKEYDECMMWCDKSDRVAIAFDDNSLMFAVSLGDEADAHRAVRKRFDADNQKESIMDNEGFRRMMDNDDDVSACLMMGNALEMMSLYAPGFDKVKRMYKDYHLDEMSLVAGLNFGDESIEAYMEYIAESDDAQKQLDKVKGLMQEVTCKYWDMIPSNTILVAGGGVHGEKYWQELNGMEAFQKAFSADNEAAQQAKELLKQLLCTAEGEGVFAIGVPEDDSAQEPDYYAFVDITSRSDAEKVLDWCVENNGTTTYYNDDYERETVQIFAKDEDGRYLYLHNLWSYRNGYDSLPQYYVMGATDKYFYFSNHGDYHPGDKPSGNIAGKEYAERVKGNVAYAVFDFEPLFANEVIKRKIDRTPLGDYTDRFSTCEMYLNKDCRLTARCGFKNLKDGETPLKVISDLALEVMNKKMR